MATRFGTIIATRRLAQASSKQPVTVELGRPRRRRTGEWACPYRIRGLVKDRSGLAYGVDSVQALHLALEAIRLDLEPFRAQLTWFRGEPGELFLPRYVPYYFGEAFALKLGKLIDEELRRENRRIRERTRRRSQKRKAKGRSRGAAA
jgi:hypothetical protein